MADLLKIAPPAKRMATYCHLSNNFAKRVLRIKFENTRLTLETYKAQYKSSMEQLR